MLEHLRHTFGIHLQGLLDLVLSQVPVTAAVVKDIIQTLVTHVLMHRDMNWTLTLILRKKSLIQMIIEFI